MGSQDGFDAELLLEVDLHLIEVDRALSGFHGRFDAGTQVDRIDGAIQVPGDLSQLLDPRHDQAGAVSAVRHGDQVDLIVLSELAVFLLDSLETLRACDTRMVLDFFAVKDGYIGHDDLLCGFVLRCLVRALATPLSPASRDLPRAASKAAILPGNDSFPQAAATLFCGIAEITTLQP
jgi:hypothetical protein